MTTGKPRPVLKTGEVLGYDIDIMLKFKDRCVCECEEATRSLSLSHSLSIYIDLEKTFFGSLHANLQYCFRARLLSSRHPPAGAFSSVNLVYVSMYFRSRSLIEPE